MKRIKKKHGLLFPLVFANVLLFVLAVHSVSPAASADKVVSLREALILAMEGNPEIRAFDHGVLAAREDIGIAGSYLLPKLTFEERFMRTNNPTYAFMAKLNQGRFEQADFAIDSLNNPDAVNDFQTSLSIEQAVFAPKASVGRDMATNEFAAKVWDFERKKEEVAFGVFKTYLGVQTVKEFCRVGEKSLKDAEEHLRIARARYDASLGLYSDMLRAQVAVAAAKDRLATARKNLDVGKRALGLMLGLDGSVDVSEERPSLSLQAIDYYHDRLAQRKDLQSLETRYKNADNLLRLANAGYLPVVGVGGSYQMNDHSVPLGAEGDSWQFMAFLRWEIFDGTKREHERQKAKQQVAEAGEHLNGLKKQIAFSVFEAYLGVNEAQQGLEFARAAHEAAEEGRRLVSSRYENSLSPMVDLLDVQTSLDAARANVVAREGAYLSAIANLGFQSGTLLGDLGLEQKNSGGMK